MTITRKTINDIIEIYRNALNGKYTEDQGAFFNEAYEIMRDSEYCDKGAILDAIDTVTSQHGRPDDIITDIADIENDLLEVCDGLTPVYNDDAIQWLSQGSNYKAVDEYVDETGAQDYKGIMTLIGQAYCWTLEKETRATLENIIEKLSEQEN